MNKVWKREDGASLSAESDMYGNLENIIPTNSGIYLWRYNLTHNLLKIHNLSIFNRMLEWSSRELAWQDSVKINNATTIEHISVKGSGLSEKKLETLQARLGYNETDNTFDSQKYGNLCFDFLDSLSDQSHVIYVGESDNLAERILSHIKGNSDLSERLKEIGFSCKDLVLYYYTFDESDKDFRQTLEFFTNILTGAWLVRRSG